MAKVLHVSDFHLLRLKTCCFSQISFKLTNGLIRNGHFVVNYPDRDLCRTFGFGHMNFWGKKKLQEHFINYCRFFKPDVLLIGHVDTIETETFLKVREELPDLRVVQRNVDWINVESENPTVIELGRHNVANINRRLPAVDVTLITTADKTLLSQFKQDGKKVGFLPNPVDKTVETARCFEHEDLPYDVMFCAGKNSLRQFCGQDVKSEEIARRITEHVSGLHPLFAGLLGTPLLHANDYQDALATAAMGLNLSRINDTYLYTSDRLAHIMGNGQLAFVDSRVGYQDLFDKDEMAFYTEPADLYEQITYYKKNPKARMKVAQKGWEKYHRLFNEQVIAKYVMDLAMDTFNAEDYPWPTLV